MSATGNNITRCAKLVKIALLSASGLVAADELKPLSEYAKVDRLWLGSDQGAVRPAGYTAYNTGSEGFLQLHVKDGARLQKDQCWATLNPKQLAAEQKAMELNERRLEIDLEEVRRTARDEQAKRNLELHELENKKQVLLEASQSDELSQALRQRAREATQNIDKELELARARATDERFELETQLGLEEVRLAAERDRNQFEMITRRSQLIASFDGELRFGDILREHFKSAKDEMEPIWFDANQPIATLVNEEHFEINISNLTTFTGGVPPEQLLASLHDGQSGRLIIGDYASSTEVDRAGEILRSFKFKVRDKSLQDARKATGQMNMVQIYRMFDEPIHLVFKKDLAFVAPEILEKGGWVAVVHHVWEDAEVIQVGPQSIAIKAKP